MKTKKIATPADWKNLEFHPLSELTSFCEETAKELADSMTKHGYDPEEAVILYEGKILDARHRFTGCKIADITPTFRQFVGLNAGAYVCKKLFRQHLTTSQRAHMAATYAKIMAPAKTTKSDDVQTDGRSRTILSSIKPKSEDRRKSTSESSPSNDDFDEAAKSLNVSSTSVKTAAKVQKTGTPELNEAVKSGKVTVADAAKIADKPAAVQNKAVDDVKAGKTATVAQAANLCDRCKRKGVIKGCEACAELKAPKKKEKPTKPTGRGEPIFDWPEHDKFLGALVRSFDKIANAYTKASSSSEFKAMNEALKSYAKHAAKLRVDLGGRK